MGLFVSKSNVLMFVPIKYCMYLYIKKLFPVALSYMYVHNDRDREKDDF